MARAGAKRRQKPVRHDHDRRKHKDSGGQRFEETLFFNRLRKQAKWVFVLLAVVFAGGFVLFGVGSSNLSGLSDIFSGIRGGGGGPSVKKELKRTQEHPKDAQAWHDLAMAYDTNGEIDLGIGAWTIYTQLRPKDAEGLTQLATDYTQRFATQTDEARQALAEAQTAQPSSTFGPPASSPLGRAFENVPDQIAKTVSGSAGQRYSAALSARQTTATELADIYARIAKLQPTEPSAQLQLAQAAQDAGRFEVAIKAYKTFVKLDPFSNQARDVKQQIKVLTAQLASTPQG